MRIGFGYDVHRLVEDRELILGGVRIPYEMGLLGHSDADVLVHTIMDSILGALALGDIGQHFPDNDMKYKDISSMILLEKVYQLMDKEGYEVGNLDLTIGAEKPKLAPYIRQMRENLAEGLNCSVDKINIKATTTEGLGFVGQKEGMATYGVCLLRKKID